MMDSGLVAHNLRCWIQDELTCANSFGVHGFEKIYVSHVGPNQAIFSQLPLESKQGMKYSCCAVHIIHKKWEPDRHDVWLQEQHLRLCLINNVERDARSCIRLIQLRTFCASRFQDTTVRVSRVQITCPSLVDSRSGSEHGVTCCFHIKNTLTQVISAYINKVLVSVFLCELHCAIMIYTPGRIACALLYWWLQNLSNFHWWTANVKKKNAKMVDDHSW